MDGATVDSATVDSAAVDGAHDVAAVGEHSRLPYLFAVVWFPRSGAAHTIASPYDGARRVTASATQDAGFTIVTFFFCARAPENV